MTVTRRVLEILSIVETTEMVRVVRMIFLRTYLSDISVKANAESVNVTFAEANLSKETLVEGIFDKFQLPTS